MSGSGRLNGKVAIITGAAQGIGAEYARALSGEGASVVVADVLDANPVVEAIVEDGGKALAVHCDVTNPASVQSMVAATLERFGRLDILVNNAALFGNVKRKPFEEIESEEWDRMMAVNVRGPFECVKAVAPTMRSQKYGKIVNIASGTVFKGQTMLLHYVTSKGAIVAMTRSLARELGDDGIRVNTLAPGLVMSENVKNNWAPGQVQNTVNTRAIKRELTPEDMCGTLIYLCSPESDFVTGQVLVVDGGAVMH
ncbi:MAG: 3-oxoacyl-ACP reductase FabG [Herbaspirillum sp.]|uniref:SDR family NAD(P)-dependent oxidoreductase n=1 Tax=Herbaspirillum sp. TaxID=1890675 RepID=UPI00258F085B|nr:3-oxoacyl-ACP reductase family protein [Herbaspirillum sp.]MCP3656962.1 3-oxoacyl-ACP reductase FabG [Herbaspirillum sp.]MCP3949023.1 3-oxoacyl-ACP reductase FabG [Herbaspirillum sp.]MCP4030447.1 3-oxoacyl-ACP reductase FabG [Herbaspirillum sp.]MCP4557799.1 3-oxoacyl-ACP reductase FabG [Herbaspirillum sp.]